jgi:two-component system cell cycle response regulator
MYPASMCLFALAAWQPVKRQAGYQVAAPHTIVLTLLAGGCALTLLVVAAFVHVTPLAVGLAAGALVFATVRAARTYLENVRMLRRRAYEAITGGLSGLGNRRSLMIDLEHAVNDSHDGHASTLVSCDLNGFKRYNDSFGHTAGDALLARLGAGLRNVVGAEGHPYRPGGDEFCLLLAGRFARHERLIQNAAAALTERGSGFTVSASFGLAIVPDDASSASAAPKADAIAELQRNACSQFDPTVIASYPAISQARPATTQTHPAATQPSPPYPHHRRSPQPSQAATDDSSSPARGAGLTRSSRG